MKWLSLSIIIVLIFGIWSCVNDKDYTTKEYVVKQGDTLWSVVLKESDMSGDIRKVVYDTYRLNGISQNEDIYPGQVILIPTESR